MRSSLLVAETHEVTQLMAVLQLSAASVFLHAWALKLLICTNNAEAERRRVARKDSFLRTVRDVRSPYWGLLGPLRVSGYK